MGERERKLKIRRDRVKRHRGNTNLNCVNLTEVRKQVT